MKYRQILFIVLAFFSFKLNAQNSSESFSKLLGKWTISKSISRGESGKSKEMEVLCNLCSVITFTSNQNAVVKKPSGKTESYIWRINENKISFVNVGAEKVLDPIFDSAEFSMNFSNRENSLELELVDLEKHGSIVLSK